MYYKTLKIKNGSTIINYHIFLCDHCLNEIEESWPHYFEPTNGIHYCRECSFIFSKISEKEYLRYCGIGISSFHASIKEGKVYIWTGSAPPWEMTNQKHRKTAEYQRWRKTVLDRDNHKCRYCDSKDKLHAHHIKSFAKHIESRFQISNGLTLCEDCHRKEHARLRGE